VDLLGTHFAEVNIDRLTVTSISRLDSPVHNGVPMQELNFKPEDLLEERSGCFDVGYREHRLQPVQLMLAGDACGSNGFRHGALRCCPT